MKHSNRILVSCLHPDHPVRKQTILKVSYKVSDKCDRGANKVSGKRKKGGQVIFINDLQLIEHFQFFFTCEIVKMISIYKWLNETAPILAITTKESEDPVLIQVGIRGHLIEVNKRLVDNPKLLLENSEGAGYLAIVLPKANELENPLTSEHKLDQDRIEADLLTDEDAGSFFS